MKQQIKPGWVTATGLLLSLPTAYFIFISLLKYWMNINEPLDSIQPTLERWGIGDSLGWNINLLILFGPVIGLILALVQIVKINGQLTKDHFQFQVIIRKKWFPILVGGFSAGLLAILFLYALGENCIC